MLEYVAVPDVAEFIPGIDLGSRREIEARDDSRDVAGIGFDRVFPGGAFVRFRRHGNAGENQLASLHVGLHIEGLTIQYLKLDQVNVHGMDVAGGVGEGPDFHGAGFGIFGDGIVPVLLAESPIMV